MVWVWVRTPEDLEGHAPLVPSEDEGGVAWAVPVTNAA